jgi:hypothetical protein
MAATGTPVRMVVLAVVEDEAREELDYLRGLSELDDARALRRLRKNRVREETLGFGVTDAVTLVSGAVWFTLDQAAREFATRAGDNAESGLQALVRTLLRRKAKPVLLPTFSAAQCDLARTRVYDAMIDGGFSKRRATAVADRVFRELSVAGTAPPSRREDAEEAPSEH